MFNGHCSSHTQLNINLNRIELNRWWAQLWPLQILPNLQILHESNMYIEIDIWTTELWLKYVQWGSLQKGTNFDWPLCKEVRIVRKYWKVFSKFVICFYRVLPRNIPVALNSIFSTKILQDQESIHLVQRQSRKRRRRRKIMAFQLLFE